MNLRILLICFALMVGIGPLAARADAPFVTSIASTSAITTGTTTQVLAKSASPTLIYFLGVQGSGTNSTDTFQFEYSPNAACASSNTVLTPGTQAAPTTAGAFAATIGNNASAPSPVSVPFVLPAGNYLCVVTAGTTVALYATVWYAAL